MQKTNCLDHNKMWKIPQEMGISHHLIFILRNQYAGQETTVRTGHRTTDWFQIGKGVRQGFIWSPCLFSLNAEYIMKNARLDEAQADFKRKFSSVTHSCPIFVTPWTAIYQAFPSTTNSWSLLKPISIESVIPSNHLILYHSLFLPPSVFHSIRVFSNESVLPIRWPKYWSFSFSTSPSNEYSGMISFWMDWLISLQSKGL